MCKFNGLTLCIILILLPSQCEANMENKATRLVTYDGLLCPQSDVLFLQMDVRSRIECVTRCAELSECACVFYKQDYCQGCQGLCHNGATFLSQTGTTYSYVNKGPAISSAAGVFNYGSKYYLISTFTATWENALIYCQSLQATLLYVETEAELDFLAPQLDPSYHWSGGILSTGQWVWSHSGAPINMTLFAPSRPNSNGSDQCVHLLNAENFRLDDSNCINLKRFICKSV